MAGRIQVRVSLVILLIDDFTNRVIAGNSARVWIPGEKPPISKAEGYYVFTNLFKERAEIFIESGMYETQIVQVDLPRDAGSYGVQKVRMIPSRSYHLPAGTTCVEGNAEPGSRIHLFCRREAKVMKLLYDYTCSAQEGSKICIYHPGDMEIEGKILCIESREGDREFFRISGKAGDGGMYRLSAPLERSYKKIGTAIYPVYAADADSKGDFFLPILNLGSDVGEFYCEAVGKDTVNCCCGLEKGRVNRLKLLKEE